MTSAERRTLLVGYVPFFMPEAERPAAIGEGFVPGVPRVGIPGVVESDASLGIASQGGVLRGNDTATALPSGAAMASTWSPQLVEEAGAAIGDEARRKGIGILLAGGVNLVRDPRNGRNFEYLGEDPLLAGTLVGHAIRGIQSKLIISTIKHFALNAQESGRVVLSANLGEAALRESDLLAFEIGIEIGRPGSVMCAYNQVNGVYACENSFLLNDVLRRDWGYKGFVMSDWGAVHSVAIRAGLDQESGQNPKNRTWFGAKLVDALASGKVDQADVNRSATRILRSMYANGLIDEPVKDGQPIDYVAHARAAQKVAEAGIVLLKNDTGLLPITRSAKTILVVGAHADVGVLGGGGSSQVNPVGGASLVLPIPGEPIYHRILYAPSSPLLALRARLPGATIRYDDGTDPARAAKMAAEADLVLVFAEQYLAEGKDAPDLALPDGQDRLVDAVAAANSRTAVILETGGPVTMPWIDRVSTVVEAWYPGQRGGEAIARVLTGEVDASGHLPMTFPTSIDQTPNPRLQGLDVAMLKGEHYFDHPPGSDIHFPVSYREGADVGYRWYERTRVKPLFAFGHGLSFTKFSYSGFQVGGGRTITARVTVTNVGSRRGIEVAQVYAQVGGTRHLIGWRRIELAPGERRTVEIVADPRLIAAFDVGARRWRVAGGSYRVDVGSASDEVRMSGTAKVAPSTIRP